MSKRNALRMGNPQSMQSVSDTITRYGALTKETSDELIAWLEEHKDEWEKWCDTLACYSGSASNENFKAHKEATLALLSSRDTYWKERVRKIVDIVKYDSCVYQGGYAGHRAKGGDELRKILLQSITNEDNLK